MPDPARRTLLVVLPTDRDDEYLANPELRHLGAERIEPLGSLSDALSLDFDEGAFFDESLTRLTGRKDLAGIVGTDDFPASFLASLLGERLGLPAPPFRSAFLAQHKWYSRQVQRLAAPDATPRCALLDLARPIPDELPLPPPFFAKPVKSFASVLSRRIESRADLERLVADAREQLPSVARGFDALVARSELAPKLREVTSQALVLEELIVGRQVTLDGFVSAGEVTVLGIVDSHFVPGTRSFERFEAPSRLPPIVQRRMVDVARRVVTGHGLDRVVFNVEMCWDEATDLIRVIELNPRMASQFVPIYRALESRDLYQLQVALALGMRVRDAKARAKLPHRAPLDRPFGAAASFVLRSRDDALVRRVPSAAEIAAMTKRFPSARVELLVSEGDRLSDHFQDGETFRYAIVDLAARNHEELQAAFAAARMMLRWEFA